MKNISTSLFICVLAISTIAPAQAQTHVLKFDTEYGQFRVMLYDFTPRHRDMMLQAVQNGEYNQALFNRIIENFVVQGGEHDLDIAKTEAANPILPQARLAAEFHQKAFHKLGALGAGRDGNPAKASFLNQIYIVVGKTVVQSDLDSLEEKKEVRFTEEQKKQYLTIGGLPRLDGDYTIFGEVTEGMDVVLAISRQKTDTQDFPLKKVAFSITKIQKPAR